MSLTDSQPAPTAEVVAAPSSPPWLDYLEQSIKEEKEDHFGDAAPFEIVRDLMLAPAEDGDAIAEAVQRFQESYVCSFLAHERRKEQGPEYGAGAYLNSLAMTIFETVDYLCFTDPKHDRLANFLIAIKASAARECDPDDPKFVFYSWGLEAAGAESWNGAETSALTRDGENLTVTQLGNRWLSTAALIAKLFKGGLWDSYGLHWITGDFRSAFETTLKADIATNVGRQAQVLAVANHILIAGEEIVKEVQSPSEKRRYELSKEKWRSWAEKLKETADAAPEDAPWDLKGRTQAAYDKMVELLPEAFETT